MNNVKLQNADYTIALHKLPAGEVFRRVDGKCFYIVSDVAYVGDRTVTNLHTGGIVVFPADTRVVPVLAGGSVVIEVGK